ncbi:MAG: amino acid adenylation domain-containing protein [Pseudomonadota bacterium]
MRVDAQHATITRCLARAALTLPHHTACEFMADTLSYATLQRRVNQLANELLALGVTQGDRVGIYMPKSINTPVALHGIMAAGAAYVPLDPSAPADRIASIINACGIRIIVSAPAQQRALKTLAKLDTPLTTVIGADVGWHESWRDVPFERLEARSSDAPDIEINESDLAYIIFTSGSTGTPKGIVHTHRSCLSFSQWAVDEYQLTSADRMSNHAPLHFDLSIMDYFSAVIVGATTIIVPEEYTKLPASYSQLIETARLTVLYTVPFALIQLLLRGALKQRDFRHLRYAIFGGEPFPTAHLRALMDHLPHVRFDNIYGPAEVNGVSHFTVQSLDTDQESVPIGPIADHAKSLIVDSDDRMRSPGETGELLVHAPSMMVGYWQDEVLTQRSLYRSADGDVYFRTGDLVQADEQGVMRFVGRKDRQVKMRGYRVELDEIELALTAINAVEEGAAYVVQTEPGVNEIRAEVTLNASAEPAALLQALKRTLPWYAVPAALSVRQAFVRTTTGKIDRRELALQAQAALNAHHAP